MASLLVASLVIAACAPASQGPSASKSALPAGATLEPGVLTVAVDPTYPPFAGKADGRLVGLDVDVAAALADKLGLKVAYVESARGKPASAKADLGLSGYTTKELVAAKAKPGGVYAFDGPALFASAPATLSLDDLHGLDPAAQERSEAWWRLRDRYGDAVASLGTLRDALSALADGRAGVVGADALVGGYIARDFKGIVPAGTIAVYPVEVAVVGADEALSTGVRKALLDLETSGTLGALRAKWAGPAAAYAARAARSRFKPISAGAGTP